MNLDTIRRRALDAHLAEPERRPLLFAGLQPALFQIAPCSRPADQLWADLLFLHQHPTLVGVAGPPLAIWLDNAARLCEVLPQGAFFAEQARRLRGPEAASPSAFDRLRAACATEVERTCRMLQGKFTAELYVHRGIEREIDQYLAHPDPAGRPAMLVVDRAGSGKTNLLAALARAHVQQRPTWLLFGSHFRGGTDDLIDGIGKLALDAGLAPTVQAGVTVVRDLAASSPGLVLVDAINEGPNPKAVRQALERMFHVFAGTQLRFVLTCRDIYWGFLQNAPFWEAVLTQPPLGGMAEFSAAEFETARVLYFATFQIRGELRGEAAARAQHPLLLRFFCEAYAGEEVGEVKDIRLVELFDTYWRRKIEGVAQHFEGEFRLEDRIARALLEVGLRMLDSGSRSLPLAVVGEATGDPNPLDGTSLYVRILDEDVILEEERDTPFAPPRVAFVYEEFMEYTIARGLAARLARANLEEVLATVERLAGDAERFRNLLGTMIHLAILLRRDRGIRLWSSLAQRGPVWQGILLETFRKLPEEHLDVEVFEVIGELLLSEDPSLQRALTELFKLHRVARRVPPALVDVLAQKAASSDVGLRRRAVTALARIPGPQVLGPLQVALHDGSGDVREMAGRSLASRVAAGEADEVLPSLAFTRGDANSAVRAATAQAFEGLSPRRRAEILEHIEACFSRDQSGVLQWIRAYGAMGGHVSVLAELYSHNDDWSVRHAVTESLVLTGSPEALRHLNHWLPKTEGFVRAGLLGALADLGDPGATQALVDGLQSGNFSVQEVCLDRLADRLDEAPVRQALQSAARSPDRSLRQQALLVLGEAARPDLADDFLYAVKDEHPPVREAAYLGLAQAGAVSSAVQEALLAGFADTDAAVRHAAAKALGSLPDDAAIGLLIATARSRQWPLRRAAAIGLGERSEPQALQVLGELSRDSSTRVQEAAIDALIDSPSSEADGQLLLLLASDTARAAAQRGLLKRHKTTSLPKMLERAQAADRLSGLRVGHANLVAGAIRFLLGQRLDARLKAALAAPG